MTSDSNPQTQRHAEEICRWLVQLLERKIATLRSARDRSNHEFMGLHISELDVDALVVAPWESAQGSEEHLELLSQESVFTGQFPDSRIHAVAVRFGLDEFERRVLALVLAPEFDLRFQELFAYAQNDVTRRLPSVALALDLLCANPTQRWLARQSFGPNASLFRNGLLHNIMELAGREVPSRAALIRAERRITDFVFGDQQSDRDLRGVAALLSAPVETSPVHLSDCDLERLWRLVPLLESGGLVHLSGPHGVGKLEAARLLAGELQRPLLVCDLRSRRTADPFSPTLLLRECLLTNAALYIKLAPTSNETRNSEEELAALLERATFPVFVSLEASNSTSFEILGVPTYRILFEPSDISSRELHWRRELPEGCNNGLRREIELLSSEFRLTSGQISEVVREARTVAALRAGDRQIHAPDIRAAIRNLCNSHVSGIAERVELLFSWNDLILPPRILQQLREIEGSVCFRHVVHGRWGFGTRIGKNAGIAALFCGVSGTGKTMAAGVLARSLGLELYRIDLSRIVSKYIGETEQNLRRVFEEAERSNAVLFFDEADALFGKRSEVKDAHDRYANIEVAYLLQRMEQFTGLAVLATNLSRNIDSAFVRRIGHIIEFPFPDSSYRERIWRQMFPEQTPIASDVDFSFLSRQFELSGGNIRNAVVAAAFLAAQQDQPVAMQHLVQAVGREMQKMGKLPSKADFQQHFEVISGLNGKR